jgi:hypothetical protein
MSTTTIDPTVPTESDFKWIVLDEDWASTRSATKYGSLAEMHKAPLHLSGARAEKFRAAKTRRVPRAATPLPLA